MDRFRKNPKEHCFLSKIGERQAKYLAKRFKDEGINKIISSDYERSLQTAKPISESLSLPLDTDSGLREISKGFRETFWSKDGYDSEEIKKEISRIKKSWEKIKKEKGKIVIVAHGGTNRVIMSLALGIEPHKLRFGLNPAGITEIRINDQNEIGIRHSNDVSHLPKELRESQSE